MHQYCLSACLWSQLEDSLVKNNALRELVERRLRGHVVHSDDCGPDRQLVGPRDDVRLREVEFQLTKIAAENQALRSHQQELEYQLDSIHRKNTRLSISLS